MDHEGNALGGCFVACLLSFALVCALAGIVALVLAAR